MPLKEFCNKCGFWINPVGHEERCKRTNNSFKVNYQPEAIQLAKYIDDTKNFDIDALVDELSAEFKLSSSKKRDKPDKATFESPQSIKESAWIGDTIHRLDVQLAILTSHIEESQRTIIMNDLISKRAQKEYLTKFEPDMIAFSDMSAHAASSVFESNYYGEFRVNYQKRVLMFEDKKPLVKISNSVARVLASLGAVDVKAFNDTIDQFTF